jgi:HEAT repeat protein
VRPERGPLASAIAAALSATYAEERRQATSRIAELDRKEALPLLLTALGDSDWRVRKEATIAARAFLPDRVLLAELVRVLESADDVGLRNAAVDVLASAGHAAVRLLEEAMPSMEDSDARKLCVDALGRSRDPEALGPLEAALFDQDDNVRQAAVEAIAVVGAAAGEPAHKILIRCLGEEDRFVRLAALEGLNHLGATVPWDRIEPLLADPTSRAAALSAAALAEHEKAPMALARALVSARGGAFSQAVVALSRLAEGPLAARVAEAVRAQGPEIGARLVRIAAGRDPDLDHLRPAALSLAAASRSPGGIAAAILALGEQSLAPVASRALTALGAAALPALIEQIAAAGQPQPPSLRGRAAEVDPFSERLPVSSRRAATLALQAQLEPPPTSEPEVAAMRAAAIDVAAAIVLGGAAVSKSAPRELLAALRAAAAQGGDKDVATSALYALSRLGTEEDITLAAEQTLSPVRPIASAAESTLAALSGRFGKAARALAEIYMKSEPFALPASIMLGALGAAGELDPTEVHTEVAFLSSSATGGDARTRRAAVMAVAEIGGVWATDVLSFALADEEREVQLAAARALGRVSVDPSAGRFLETGPPSVNPPSSSAIPPPRTSATDVLELIGRSGDSDLVAVAVNALGDGMTTWAPPSIPPSSRGGGSVDASAFGLGAKSLRPSMMAGDDLIAALAPLAHKSPSAVAIAAVEALSRAPVGTPGRQSALLGALQHPDAAVVTAAILKLELNDVAADKIARCVDHPSRGVRLCVAEVLSGHSNAHALGRLRRRLAAEQDPEVRAAIERALAPAPSARREGGASDP